MQHHRLAINSGGMKMRQVSIFCVNMILCCRVVFYTPRLSDSSLRACLCTALLSLQPPTLFHVLSFKKSCQTHPPIDVTQAARECVSSCVCPSMQHVCRHATWVFLSVNAIWVWLHLFVFVCARVCVRHINRGLFWGKLCVIPTAIIRGSRVCLPQRQTAPEGPSPNVFSYKSMFGSVSRTLPHLHRIYAHCFSVMQIHTHTHTHSTTSICIQFGLYQQILLALVISVEERRWRISDCVRVCVRVRVRAHVIW